MVKLYHMLTYFSLSFSDGIDGIDGTDGTDGTKIIQG